MTDCLSVRFAHNVSAWLKLAAHLEKVEVNAWKYENGPSTMWCRPAADYVDFSSTHQSNYATDFTRFMFTASALEETYRFIDHHYHRLSHKRGRKRGRHLRWQCGLVH